LLAEWLEAKENAEDHPERATGTFKSKLRDLDNDGEITWEEFLEKRNPDSDQ
jgi:hypothetical protein